MTPTPRDRPEPVGELGGRLRALRRRIERACARCGRRPEDVVLIAASKLQPVELMVEAWRSGVRIFGENRVQEAARKQPLLPPDAEWHLLGPLQSNKARRAAELFSTVHSIDREPLAERLDREAARRGVVIEGFLEVNLGQESSKHGFPPAELAARATALARLEHLRMVGLMAIPPPSPKPEAARGWFRQLRDLRDRLVAQPGWSGFRGLLSMGMSDDFEVAIEEGATHIRVGTALFGPRPDAR